MFMALRSPENKNVSATMADKEDHTLSWIIASGASNHICQDEGAFASLNRSIQKAVHLGDNRIVQAIGIGTIRVRLPHASPYSKVDIKNVLFVPRVSCNLLSVNKLSDNGLKVSFGWNSYRF